VDGSIMPSTGTKADIYALMNAYAVLEVPYTATAGDIRRAFRQLASVRHPDKCAEGSPDQQRATERMIQLNAAYDLIRDAPLRHHRISKATGADEPWTDAELEEAIRRGHAARRAEEIGSSVVFGALGALVALMLMTRLHGPMSNFAGYSVAVIAVCGMLGALMGRRFLNLWYVLDQLFLLLRLVLR
jgi:curved DNA-binding protein CbpA